MLALGFLAARAIQLVLHCGNGDRGGWALPMLRAGLVQAGVPRTWCFSLRLLRCCAETLQPRLLTTSSHIMMHDVVLFQARDMMSYAQFLAGMAFNSASLG